MNDICLLLPVLLPIAAAFIVFRTRAVRLRNGLTLAALIMEIGLVVIAALRNEPQLVLWRITGDVSVFLRLDDAGRWFALLIAFMWACVGLYSFSYMEHEEHQDRFFLFYLLTLGVLEGLCMSGNAVTMYMFYELMTLLSLPLVLHEMTKEAVAAGIKYLIYSVLGASMALLGIFFFGRYGASLDFVPGGVLKGFEGNKGMMLTAIFLMLAGFGVKAGLFPLHGWLPTAHPVAPAPASAVLSGVITKAGVLGALRVAYYMAGADFLRGTWVQWAWMGLTLTTVFLGSMMAYREDLFKKRLAYSTVSQVSYVLFGLSTLTQAGFVGALLHIVFHSLIKDGLFMSAGAVIHKTGYTKVSELKGIGKRMPAAMWCFTLVSAGLIGIPPTGGFISKWYLASGALALEGTFVSWIGPAVLLVSAILTAGYLLTVTIRAFFPGSDFDYADLEKCEPDTRMLVPLILCAALTLILGAFPGALVEFARSIAALVL